jgi:hypothetical protein
MLNTIQDNINKLTNKYKAIDVNLGMAGVNLEAASRQMKVLRKSFLSS